MKRWSPPQKMGAGEFLGRRLFEEPMLRGSFGQREFSGLKLHHFDESRGPQTSLDRMGATGVDRKVRAYLVPRAESAGMKFGRPKAFDGWAVVQAKHLAVKIDGKECKLEASPVVAGDSNGAALDELNLNAYHAHIERPDGISRNYMALHLRHIFTDKGCGERKGEVGGSLAVLIRRWKFIKARLLDFIGL